MRIRLPLSSALLGITSILSQVVLMREMVVAFYGNEVCLGLGLGSWLLWVGLGSFFSSLLADRAQHKKALIIGAQCLICFIFPSSILFFRAVPSLLGIPTAGEVMGITPMLLSILLIFLPIGILLGFLFTMTCKALSEEEEGVRDGAEAIGKVYILEGLGAAMGGALFSYLLVKRLHSLQVAFLVSNLNLFMAFLLSLKKKREAKRSLVPYGLGLAFCLSLLLWPSGIVDALHTASLKNLRWKGLGFILSKDTPYGNISLTGQEGQRSLYENSLLIFAYPDPFSNEEAVHFALLNHPEPRRVLLIGGGISDSLSECLKHPLERVDYVELDPWMVGLVLANFPASVKESLMEERVAFTSMDGRLFVKTAPKEQYDVVIVNLPEPLTAQLNRFYTLEFFREVRAILREKGIFSFRVTSSENYISPELQQFLGCLYQTLQEAFEEVKVVPGDANVFLASKGEGVLSLEPEVLIQRLRERKLEVEYIEEYYLPYRLSPERKAYVMERIESSRPQLNRDLKPICYYYDMVLWSTYFRGKASDLFKAFASLRLEHGFLALLAFFAPLFILKRRQPGKWRGRSILLLLATTGFAEIIIEVTVLLSFQMLYGYVYSQLSVIIMAFMVGLTMGSWHMTRQLGRKHLTMNTYARVQAAVCLYPLLVVAVVAALSRLEPSAIASLSIEVSFPLLAGVAGFVGGMQYPLANTLYIEQGSKKVGASAGVTYTFDLIGSCLGALLGSVLLIPILGILNTCIFTSGLNFLGLLLLLEKR